MTATYQPRSDHLEIQRVYAMTATAFVSSPTSHFYQPQAVAKGLYINGQWRAAASGHVIDVLDPSTEKLIAKVADADEADAAAAIEAAAKAAPGWAATAPRKRAEILRRCFELMAERAEDLAWLISLENGKALRDARGEVAYAAEFFRWNAEEAVRIQGQLLTAPSGTNRIIVDYQPIGICVLITPWNFPAAMATRKIGPALAAGCTVVLKPASETPLTAYALADLYSEAGVPPGVVNVLTTSKPGPVVAKMLGDPRVRKLSFTGSTPVGRSLLAEAAKSVISSSMELGGNAPLIVFDDANLDAALEGTMIAKMRNAGQACTAANRIYVQAGVYDAFIDKMQSRMSALVVGPGTSPETDCGPTISAKARDKLERLVENAISLGAKLRCGGAKPNRDGYYYPPTVLVDVPMNATMNWEEIFGPVAAISKFTTEDEVIAKANDTEYGLAAYIFTQDTSRGFRVARQIESGMIALNRGLVSDPAAPFGGVKQSGLGREGGTHGIYEFLESKYIATSI
jgi:succinate-semialdehyde dehydrogenase/glutarate-semialdehyde dehydrogenase